MSRVLNLTTRVAVFAVAFSWAGSAKAADLATILAGLGASPINDTFTEITGPARSTFFATSDPASININIIESTQNSAFGITRGSGPQFLTFNRDRTGTGDGFQVFGTGNTLAPNPPVGSTLTRLQNTPNDTSISSRADLNGSVIGTAPFQFVLQPGTTFSGGASNNVLTRTLTSNGSGPILDSTDSSFRAFAINSGDDAGSFLIAFEQPSSETSQGFTFAAIISGVATPEPASLAMLATGVVGLVGYRLRRRGAAPELAPV